LKKILSLIFMVLIICTPVINASFVPYNSYTYNYDGEVISAPPAYLPVSRITGDELGVNELSNPRDLHVQDNKLYLMDSGNNRIIVINEKYDVIEIIDEIIHNDQVHNFDSPRGIFVTDQENIYIADTENNRIVVLKSYKEPEVINIIEKPEQDAEGVISSDYIFYPEKIGVDSYGSVYAVARATYDGIMKFDPGGTFEGFIGAPYVSPDLFDLFWHTIATEEQRQRRTLYLPIEFLNLDVDSEGFVYAINPRRYYADDEIVKRLNPAGVDRLRRGGFHPVIGDLREYEDEEDFYNRFVDIIARENDIYTVLCGNTGRLYTYDRQGNLLYIFGGYGEQLGLFIRPAAIAEFNNKMLVLDRRENDLTIFRRTEYASMIHQALLNYEQGRYEQAVNNWQNVLNQNNNYSLAYRGLALANFRDDAYQTAMLMSEMAEDRSLYSNVFTYYRQEVLRENFNLAIYSFLFLLFAGIGIKTLKNSSISRKSSLKSAANKRLKKIKGYNTLLKILADLKFGLYVIFHPFGGFWDLKNERGKTTPAATIILIGTIITYLFFRQYSAFVFREWSVTNINIYQEMANILVPFFLWCIVNWSFTTLMEGKGTIKDIYNATAYSLLPIILIIIPLTIIGHYLTLNEGAFYWFFIIVSIIWTLLLIFTGTIVIHEYSLTKTVITCVFIMVGIGMSLFLFLLFLNLINMLIGFGNSVYREVFIR